MEGLAQVDFAEDGTTRDILDIVTDMGEGVVVQDGPFIELAIISNDSEAFTLFFMDKVNWT